MTQKHGSTWTERTGHSAATGADDLPHHSHKQPFHHSSTGLGSYGHLIRLAGTFIPLAAGELVTDGTKYKKIVRLASIGTAAAYEIGYVYQEHQRAKEREAELAECRGRD